jgi:hypothetical protein
MTQSMWGKHANDRSNQALSFLSTAMKELEERNTTWEVKATPHIN